MKNNRRFYNTCNDCGANLDPGERCDCQSIKQNRCINCHTAVPAGQHLCLVCRSTLTSVKEVH